MVRILNTLNNCYLNVILHVMALFPNSFFEELAAHFLIHQCSWCFSCLLHQVFEQYHNRTLCINPRKLVKLFCLAFHFEFRKFQDANEAFMKIMDWIKEDIPTLTPILTPFSIGKKMCPTCAPKDIGVSDRVILGVTEANQYKSSHPNCPLADVLRNSQTDQCSSCGNTPASVQQNFFHGPREFFIEVKWNSTFSPSDLSTFLETIRERFYLKTATSTSSSTSDSTQYDLQSIICFRRQHYITFVKKGLYYILHNDDEKSLRFVNMNEVKEFLIHESYIPTLIVYCSDPEILEDAKDLNLNPIDSMNFATLKKSENQSPPSHLTEQNTQPFTTSSNTPNTQPFTTSNHTQNTQPFTISDTPQHSLSSDYFGLGFSKKNPTSLPPKVNKKRKAFEELTNPTKYQRISCLDPIIIDD